MAYGKKTPKELRLSPTAWIGLPYPCFVLFRHLSRPYQTIWILSSHFRSYGTILDHSNPFFTIWNHFRTIWTVLILFELFQNLGHFRPFRTILVHFGPFLVQIRPFLPILGLLVPIWSILGHRVILSH
jgi:hypothetical protein